MVEIKSSQKSRRNKEAFLMLWSHKLPTETAPPPLLKADLAAWAPESGDKWIKPDSLLNLELSLSAESQSFFFFFFLNEVSCPPVGSPFSGSSPAPPPGSDTKHSTGLGWKSQAWIPLYIYFLIYIYVRTKEISGKCDKSACISETIMIDSSPLFLFFAFPYRGK